MDVGKVAEVLAKADLRFVALAAAFYFALNVLMSWRIKALLEEMGERLKLAECVKANFAGMIASDFTPARSGYFLTALVLTSKFKAELEKTMLSIFGPQIVEFAIKAVCLALMLLVLFQHSFLKDSDLTIVIASVLVIFAVIGFFGALVVSPRLLGMFSFVKQAGPGRKIFALFKLMQDNSKVLFKRWGVVLGTSVSTWLMKGFEWYLLAKALGITVIDPVADIWFFLLLHPTVTLMQFIPIPTLAGAGTSEAVMTGILMMFGVPAADGLAFALLTRFLMIAVDLLGVPTLVGFAQGKGLSNILGQINGIEEKVGAG